MLMNSFTLAYRARIVNTVFDFSDESLRKSLNSSLSTYQRKQSLTQTGWGKYSYERNNKLQLKVAELLFDLVVAGEPIAKAKTEAEVKTEE